MEEEARRTIIDMVNQIDRLDVLEYIKIIVADIKAELEDSNGGNQNRKKGN